MMSSLGAEIIISNMYVNLVSMLLLHQLLTLALITINVMSKSAVHNCSVYEQVRILKTAMMLFHSVEKSSNTDVRCRIVIS